MDSYIDFIEKQKSDMEPSFISDTYYLPSKNDIKTKAIRKTQINPK